MLLWKIYLKTLASKGLRGRHYPSHQLCAFLYKWFICGSFPCQQLEQHHAKTINIPFGRCSSCVKIFWANNVARQSRVPHSKCCARITNSQWTKPNYQAQGTQKSQRQPWIRESVPHASASPVQSPKPWPPCFGRAVCCSTWCLCELCEVCNHGAGTICLLQHRQQFCALWPSREDSVCSICLQVKLRETDGAKQFWIMPAITVKKRVQVSVGHQLVYE